MPTNKRQKIVVTKPILENAEAAKFLVVLTTDLYRHININVIDIIKIIVNEITINKQA